MEAIAVENFFENDFKQAAAAFGITSPCCKSFDEFIDAERLRPLDSYITEKTNHHFKRRRADYFFNLYRRGAEISYRHFNPASTPALRTCVSDKCDG